ncbi:MAG: oligoribonuclease [Bradymonadaceae bacterium]
MPDASNLVWIDLEMSGLDPDNDVILEIATIVTGPDLEIVAEGPSLVIHQSDEILEGMDEWNTKHHGESGLTERVRASEIDTEEAETRTLEFLREYVEPESAPLCGNSIGQDRRFLYRYMPDLSDFLHYRNIDVSSIKELVARWYDDVDPPQKETRHRALDDIRESIEELRYYRNQVFKPSNPEG